MEKSTSNTHHNESDAISSDPSNNVNNESIKSKVQPTSPPNPPLQENVPINNLTEPEPKESINILSKARKKSPIMCRDFIRGNCTRPECCRYSHECDISQLEGILKFCHDFENDICRHTNCRYAHASSIEVKVFFLTGYLPPHVFNHIGNVTPPPPTPPLLTPPRYRFPPRISRPPPPPPPPIFRPTHPPLISRRPPPPPMYRPRLPPPISRRPPPPPPISKPPPPSPPISRPPPPSTQISRPPPPSPTISMPQPPLRSPTISIPQAPSTTIFIPPPPPPPPPPSPPISLPQQPSLTISMPEPPPPSLPISKSPPPSPPISRPKSPLSPPLSTPPPPPSPLITRPSSTSAPIFKPPPPSSLIFTPSFPQPIYRPSFPPFTSIRSRPTSISRATSPDQASSELPWGIKSPLSPPLPQTETDNQSDPSLSYGTRKRERPEWKNLPDSIHDLEPDGEHLEKRCKNCEYLQKKLERIKEKYTQLQKSQLVVYKNNLELEKELNNNANKVVATAQNPNLQSDPAFYRSIEDQKIPVDVDKPNLTAHLNNIINSQEYLEKYENMDEACMFDLAANLLNVFGQYTPSSNPSKETD